MNEKAAKNKTIWLKIFIKDSSKGTWSANEFHIIVSFKVKSCILSNDK